MTSPKFNSPEEQASFYRKLCELVESRERVPKVKFFLAPEAKRLIPQGMKPPKPAYNGDAGCDLRLCSTKGRILEPGDRAMVYSGVGFEIPDGWWGNILPRTSMGKRGLIPVARVVDSNFTGILTLCIANVGNTTQVLEPFERCAQIVFTPHMPLNTLEEIDIEDVKKTERGDGAFGSSGTH